MKKILIENFLVLVISFLAIDVVISNTILDLKSKSCYVLYDFYFELKKNCKGKEKVKASLPTVNIYTDNNALKIINKSREECLKAFHVIDGDKIYKETDAFFILWKDIKYFKILYYLFNFKLFKNFLNIFYKMYAKYRYKKLYIKNEAVNEENRYFYFIFFYNYF